MLQMAHPEAEEDPRFWAMAYVEFLARDHLPESRKNRRLLEKDARFMAQAMGNFALFLMDATWLPNHFGVDCTTSWLHVDSLRRLSPGLEATLARRDRYRRLGQGLVVRPTRSLRKTAGDAVGMLLDAHMAECYPGLPTAYGSDAVVAMLTKYRILFSQTSDGPGNS